MGKMPTYDGRRPAAERGEAPRAGGQQKNKTREEQSHAKDSLSKQETHGPAPDGAAAFGAAPASRFCRLRAHLEYLLRRVSFP